jgi:hypothetical protein
MPNQTNNQDSVALLIEEIDKNYLEHRDDWETRRNKIIELGEIGQSSPVEALNALAYRAVDEDTIVFQSAVRAILDIWALDSGELEGPQWNRKFARFLEQSNNVQKIRSALELLKTTVWQRDQETVIEPLLKKLESMSEEQPEINLEIRQAAADWLGEQSMDLVKFQNNLVRVLNRLIERIKFDGDENVINSAAIAIRKILSEMQQVDHEWLHILVRVLGDLDERDRLYVQKFKRTLDLLSEGVWNKRRGPILKPVQEALDRNTNWEIRYAAADWVYRNSEDIGNNESHRSFKNLAVSLKLCRDQDEDPSVRNIAEAAVNKLRDSRREARFEDLKTILASKTVSETVDDEDTMSAIIEELADQELGSREALRRLVDAYVRWIINDQYPQLVELLTENMRYNWFAVLPLVQYFEGNPIDRNMAAGKGKSASGEAEAELQQKDRRAKIQLRVHKRIARLLAEMSDPRFFDIPAQQIAYDGILNELKKHALPVLVQRLPDEKDREIRENIVRTLGYISTREAVEALTRQVVGDEKGRNERQSLLSTYYLEPSKNRSRQARAILKKAIEDARRTLRISQWLNISVFFAGLALLVIGLVISIQGEAEMNRVIGALSALGGFTGMIAILIKDPLDRIQNAMGDLVQVETAFTSFIWELNLNGTFIQSRYVHQGYLANDEIQQTALRMKEAMEKTMNLVSIHTETSEQVLVTRLTRLDPAAGSAGSLVTIHGQSLIGDGSHKRDRRGVLAINHHPVETVIHSWNEHMVKIELPGLQLLDGLTQGRETLMISLFIDGMETNALPFHLVRVE